MYEKMSDLLRQIALGEDAVSQQRSQVRLIRFDEQTVPGTGVDDLNPRLWNRFRTVISPRADQEFLEKMKLVSKDEDGTLRATVSGILLASDAPESFMSSAFIQAAYHLSVICGHKNQVTGCCFKGRASDGAERV